jgi:hypothetical protein
MEDLKNLYHTAGQKGKGVTFLFMDNEIKDEKYQLSVLTLQKRICYRFQFSKKELVTSSCSLKKNWLPVPFSVRELS